MPIEIFGDATAMDRSAHVRVGARFIEKKPPGRVVQVIRLVRPRSGIPHARLRAVFYPAQNALVSCRALCDPAAYQPLTGRPPLVLVQSAGTAMASQRRTEAPRPVSKIGALADAM
jgi:hypothetical protein